MICTMFFGNRLHRVFVSNYINVSNISTSEFTKYLDAVPKGSTNLHI